MSLKRKIAFTGGGLLFFVLLLVTLLAAIYLYIPHYVESNLIPQLAAEAGISDFAVSASWNPAGLFNKDNPLESPVLGLGWHHFSPESKYRPSGDFYAEPFLENAHDFLV